MCSAQTIITLHDFAPTRQCEQLNGCHLEHMSVWHCRGTRGAAQLQERATEDKQSTASVQPSNHHIPNQRRGVVVEAVSPAFKATHAHDQNNYSQWARTGTNHSGASTKRAPVLPVTGVLTVASSTHE